MDLTLTDHDGDTLELMKNAGRPHLLLQCTDVARSASAAMYLDRDAALTLYEHLGAHLATTALDAEHPCPLDPDMAHDTAEDPFGVPTILEDAQAAVYGDREADYGHPRADFTRTAILWTGLLLTKLADGEHLEPEDVARCQIAVKLARDVHTPKRDNRVDMAGYALTLDRLQTGR